MSSCQPKQLPIGTSDYKEIIEQDLYYIDKTIFIKDLCVFGGKITLLPRPRRFGKTLNLSMLQRFFEKTPQGNGHLFTQKAIWQYPSYQALQGKFPVVFITFKDVKSTIWEQAYEHFTDILAEEVKRHNDVLAPILDDTDRKKINCLISKTGSVTDFATSLKWLTTVLCKAYGTKVIVLLDEYDAPIHSAYHHGYYDQAINFLRALMSSVFKDNNFLERGVITGIMRTAKEGIFSGLNNLSVYDVLDDHFCESFGFTQHEVTQLLADYNLTDRLDEVTSWYNGYTIGSTTSMYNPWSLLNYVHRNGTLAPYWANTSDNLVIRTLLAKATATIKQKLEGLLYQHESGWCDLERSLSFQDVAKSNEQALWSFLLFTGYITTSHIDEQKGKIPRYTLKIPNQEIHALYRKLLSNTIDDVISDKIHILLEALISGKIKIVQTLLSDFIMNSMSFYDIDKKSSERSYHLFILGILVLLEGRYTVRSNRESGLGRYDIMLIPAQPTTDAGVVIEFKRLDESDEDTLKACAQQALTQIDSRNYSAQLKALGCVTIFQYGIAFEGKKMIVVMSNAA